MEPTTTEFFFAWERAAASAGPWGHLLVLSATGHEGLNEPYDYVIELGRAQGTPDVAAEELLGARATLRLSTRVSPGIRLVHGVISEVEELGDVEGGGRYRVRLSPPYVRASMMRKSVVHVDRTLKEVLDLTMKRVALGMGLEESKKDREEVDVGAADYTPFRATFAWRVVDMGRLMDRRARPYCVQYEETDLAFVSRLLEEEGVAYHFEHTPGECVMVLSDMDSCRRYLKDTLVLGPAALNREVRNMRLGGRLRPTAVGLLDYDWRKPDLVLSALSPKWGESNFQTIENPGRFGYSKELGESIAATRAEQLDGERLHGSFDTACRALSAGAVFGLEHPRDRFAGVYLVHRMRVELRQVAHFGEVRDDEPAYRAEVEVMWCGAPDVELPRSHYRPARTTPRPRIAGSQTAVVTAEPTLSQEINVGGEADLGSVRLRFHWDIDATRHGTEPTSCWVRVSQMFAGGRGHGAMFHPRVGDEVVVEFLEGDPDCPIVTGRVYNGRNLTPENATNRPTYSCIKSMTSPYDGNFNMIAFDDLQGEEQFIVHVARDYISNVKHDACRFVANFDKIEVMGDQLTILHGNQDFSVQDQKFLVKGEQLYKVVGNRLSAVGGTDIENVGLTDVTNAGVGIVMNAPIIAMDGQVVTITAPTIVLTTGCGASITLAGAVVDIKGAPIQLNC